LTCSSREIACQRAVLAKSGMLGSCAASSSMLIALAAFSPGVKSFLCIVLAASLADLLMFLGTPGSSLTLLSISNTCAKIFS